MHPRPNYGLMSMQAPRSTNSLKLALSAKPAPNWAVRLEYHFMRLHEARDAFYGPVSPVSARDTSGQSGKSKGQELDLEFKYFLSPTLSLWGGYSIFFPGAFTRNRTGNDAPLHWGYLMLTVRFEKTKRR